MAFRTVESAVLKVLRERNATASEIADVSAFSRNSIQSVAARLIDAGIVTVVATVHSGGARKRSVMLYGLAAGNGFGALLEAWPLPITRANKGK